MTAYTYPPEPDHGPLWDKNGTEWQRHDDKWDCEDDAPLFWSELIHYYGPLSTLAPLEAGLVIKNEDHLTNVEIPPGTVIESADGYLIIFDGIDAWQKAPNTDFFTFTTDPLIWVEYPAKVHRVGWPEKDQPLLPVRSEEK